MDKRRLLSPLDRMYGFYLLYNLYFLHMRNIMQIQRCISSLVLQWAKPNVTTVDSGFSQIKKKRKE